MKAQNKFLNKVAKKLMIGSFIALGSQQLAAEPAYPTNTIKILAGIAPGGTVDAIARLYAKNLSEQLKVPVVVENKPGAFQIPAIRTLLDAKPDGYTLFLTNGSAVALAPAFQKDLPYDPLKDFTYIAPIATTPAVFLTLNDIPVNTLSELISYSKENPGKLNYGSAGTGAANNLKIEYIKKITGLNATHIPYKSDAEVLRELVAGRVQFSMTTLQSAMPMISAGRVKPLGVSAPEPVAMLPNVPGTLQIGITDLDKTEPYSFYGFVGPAGMPEPIVLKLNTAINKVTLMPEVRRMMTDSYFIAPKEGSATQFREFTTTELEKAKDLAKMLGTIN